MDGSLLGDTPFQDANRCTRRPKVSDGITAQLVLDDAGFREAQALRYEAYLGAGYLSPKDDRLFSDPHDANPGSRTLVVYSDGDPAASIRVCVLGSGDAGSEAGELPASAMFRDEIDAHLDELGTDGRRPRAVEITRLARSPRYSRNVALVLGLYHVAGYLILHFHADVIFAAVTTNHTPFYRRMGFRQIAAPRDYPGLSVQTVLMSCLIGEHRGIPGRTLALRDMALSDDTYLGLVAGEAVPVFGGHATSRAELAVNRPVAERPLQTAPVSGCEVFGVRSEAR